MDDMNEQTLTAIITAGIGFATVVVNLFVLRHERKKLQSSTQLELQRLQWQKDALSLGQRAKVTTESERKAYEEKVAAYKIIAAETARMNGLLRNALIQLTKASKGLAEVEDEKVRLVSRQKLVKAVENDISSCIELVMKTDQDHSFCVPRRIHEHLTQYWLPNVCRQKEAILSAMADCLSDSKILSGGGKIPDDVPELKDLLVRGLLAEVDRAISLNRDLKDLLIVDTGM